jgi:hypothetical protein
MDKGEQTVGFSLYLSNRNLCWPRCVNMGSNWFLYKAVVWLLIKLPKQLIKLPTQLSKLPQQLSWTQIFPANSQLSSMQHLACQCPWSGSTRAHLLVHPVLSEA